MDNSPYEHTKRKKKKKLLIKFVWAIMYIKKKNKQIYKRIIMKKICWA